MHQHYDDILALTPAPPKWWDRNGYPRYCEFHPSRVEDIHAHEVALVDIRCQGCGERFEVSIYRHGRHDVSLVDLIASKALHYGDPPNIDCCPSGPTMNSVPVRVLQYWRRNWRRTYATSMLDWRCDPDLAIEVKPDWAKDIET